MTDENVSRKERQVERCLTRYLKAPSLRWDDVPDPRERRGRRWSLPALLNALFLGVMSCRRTLRAVESQTERLAGRGALGRAPARRVPDTTMHDLLCVSEAQPFLPKLHAQVRQMKRAGGLKPMVGLPCGVVSIDGKNLATLDFKANEFCQHKQANDASSEYWLQRAVRAVLTSSEAKVAVHQKMIPDHTNEMGVFEDFYAELLEAFGRGDLFRIVTYDAGATSLHNADVVHASGRYYVLGLKDNQPKLLEEAQRLFLKTCWADEDYEPEERTDWEKRSGKWIRRSLWRSRRLQGFHGWDHLEQVWMVLQETRDADGNVVSTETRLFLSSVPWDYLSARQVLHVVRGHWGIEDDCNWSLDALWKEDHGVWCTQNNAVEVLGLLRLLAYNVLQQLRKRHLPGRRPDGRRAGPMPWEELFGWVNTVMMRWLPPRVEAPGV